MDKNTNNIIKDLETKEFDSVVSTLMQSKPNTHFSDEFSAKLRAELLAPKPVTKIKSPFFTPRTIYGVLSSVLTILIAVPLTFLATQRATSPGQPLVFNPFSNQVKNIISGMTPTQQISNKGVNAFGTLALIPTSEPVARSSDSSALSNQSAILIGSSSVETGIPTAEYTGEEVSLAETESKVFKRTTGADSGKQLADIIRKSNFNLADVSTFSNLIIKDIQLAEDKPFGYAISVSFKESSISISPQWELWNEGKETRSASTSKALSGDSAIAMSNAFLKEHVIDIKSYGAPAVSSATQDSVIVTYPLILDQKEVYENGGVSYGLSVAIGNNEKKVIGVSNLTSQTYESSFYKLETDFSKVLRVATTSLGAMISADGSSATTSANIGTPKTVLMHYWQYDDKTSLNSELFIPALSFPVSYGAGDNQSPDKPSTIVVPIVKEFLDKAVTN